MAILFHHLLKYKKTAYINKFNGVDCYFSIFDDKQSLIDNNEINWRELYPSKIETLDLKNYQPKNKEKVNYFYSKFKKDGKYEKYCYAIRRMEHVRLFSAYESDYLFYLHINIIVYIIEKLDIDFIFSGPPSMGYDHVLNWIGEDSDEIKHVGVIQYFYGRFFWVRKWEDIGKFSTAAPIFEVRNLRRKIEIEPPFYSDHIQKSRNKNRSLLKRLLSPIIYGIRASKLMASNRKNYSKMIEEPGKLAHIITEAAGIPRILSYSYPKKKSKNLKILFCLKIQPEATEYFPKYLNINYVQMAERLLSLSKIEAEIYIKEHPDIISPDADPYSRRLLYEMALSNSSIKIADPTLRASQMIKDFDIIATFDGTVGWEALKSSKPVIYFGNPWYGFLPGAYHVDEVFDTSKLDCSHSYDELLKIIKEYTKLMGEGFVVDFYNGYVEADDEFSPNPPLSTIRKTEIMEDNDNTVSQSLLKIYHHCMKA